MLSGPHVNVFWFISKSDSATIARVAAGDQRHAALVKRTRQLPVLTRSLCVFALCVFASMVCRSSAFAQDNLPPIVSSASGTVPLDYLDVWSTYNPRLSVLYQSGDGVGYDEGFWSVQSFVPLAHCSDERLLFVDLHALFDENGALGGNFGLGHRVYSKALRVTVGGYVYYDYRSTGVNQFQQISPGLDVFGDGWELHANGYLPTIENTRQALPDQFRGNLLFIDRFESAMRGGDIEMGVRLPVLGRFQPRLFVGAYHFETDGRPDATGWKTRLEATMSDKLSTAFSVQDDQVFGTTANFGLEFRFSGASLLRPRPLQNIASGLSTPPSQRAALDYLAAPTRRTHQIVIDRDRGEVALDPNTGAPLMFSHVAVGGNSTGSFEDPYAFLTDALADPRYTAGGIDVIYVRGGFPPVTYTGDVVMQAGTKLLSNGPVQLVDTQLGARRLPSSGIDVNLFSLPIIQGSVQLKNNTTLSGFDVRSTDGIGAVRGDGVVAVNIRNNIVFDSMNGSGIFLQNINIVNSFDRITIDKNVTDGKKTQFAGVQITDSARFEGDITNNTLNRNSDSGIFVFNVDAFVGDVDQNTLSENDFSGFAFLDSNFEGNITNNSVNRNKFTGLEINGFISNTFIGTIVGNTIDGINTTVARDPNATRVFNVDREKRTTTLTEGDVNTSNADSFGINIQNFEINATIANNTLNNHVWGGVFIQDSSFFGDIIGNVANDNFADGISVINSTFIGQIANNTTNRNFLGGILIEVSDVFAGEIIGNTANDNGTQGILISGPEASFALGDINNNLTNRNLFGGIVIMSENFDGTLTGNTANQNGFDGIFIGSENVEADVSFNTASDNAGSGLFIGSFYDDTLSTFTGDISNNVLNSNQFSGLDVAVGTFDGSVMNNVAQSNQFTGFSILTTQSLTGHISGNKALTNQTGMMLASPVFVGNVSGNTVSQNTFDGLLFDVTERFDGSVLYNIAESNGGTGIQLFLADESFGDVSFNTTNMNNVGIQITAKLFDGFIEGNTANNNQLEGINIFIFDDSPILSEIESNDTLLTAQNIDAADFILSSNFNITDATLIPHQTISGTGDGTFDFYSFTAYTGNRGIFDIDFQNFDTELFLFDSSGTLLAENDDADDSPDPGDGALEYLDSFIDFTFSSTDLFVIGVGKFQSSADSGSISGAAPEDDDDYQLQVSIENHTVGMGSSNDLGIVDVIRNQLSGNNGGTGRELVVENVGYGTICLLFDDNNSQNTVSPGQFNFDFLNTGGGGFDLFDFNANDNTGTVGSSDGSVVIP